MRNRYFNQYNTTSEQNVLEDLIIESIKIYGIQAYYLPRTHVNLDMLFKEDASVRFDDAIELEMYLKTYDGYVGQGDFLSKFGVQIDDSLTFSIAQKRFMQCLTPKVVTEYGYNLKLENGDLLTQETSYDHDYNGYIRPLEGDLVWVPLTKDLFEVKFVENKESLYPLGKLFTYELRCDKYEYSSEVLDTEVAEIDIVEDEYSQSTQNMSKSLLENEDVLLNEAGGYIMHEADLVEEYDIAAQNDYLQTKVGDDDVLDFSEGNPFSNVKAW